MSTFYTLPQDFTRAKICKNNIEDVMIIWFMVETERQYRKALKRIEKLMKDDPHPESYDGIDMLGLVQEVIEWEDIHYPIDPPSSEIGSPSFM